MNWVSENKVWGGKYSRRKKYQKQKHEHWFFQGLERSLIIGLEQRVSISKNWETELQK